MENSLKNVENFFGKKFFEKFLLVTKNSTQTKNFLIIFFDIFFFQIKKFSFRQFFQVIKRKRKREIDKKRAKKDFDFSILIWKELSSKFFQRSFILSVLYKKCKLILKNKQSILVIEYLNCI